MIKPSVGRVVWFTPYTVLPADFLMIDAKQPCSASVAYVWNDRLVNLTVSDHYGYTHAFTSVRLLQDDDAKPEGGYFASWMPYQVGQAKKHEGPTDHGLRTIAGHEITQGQMDVTMGAGMFGDAIGALKAGFRVARKGWNGKGMWLNLQVPDANSKMSLPYIYMKTADNRLVPWLASQTDMLADDWAIVTDAS